MEVKKPGRNLFVREAGSTLPVTLWYSFEFRGHTPKQTSMKKAIAIFLSTIESSEGDPVRIDDIGPASRFLS